MTLHIKRKKIQWLFWGGFGWGFFGDFGFLFSPQDTGAGTLTYYVFREDKSLF